MTTTGYRSLAGQTVTFIGRDEIGNQIKSMVELLSGRWQSRFTSMTTIIVYDDGFAHFEEIQQLADTLRLHHSTTRLMNSLAFFDYLNMVDASQAVAPTYRFNPAPGWEIPPIGWVPPPGWQPPKEWIPAPPGWNFWVEDK